MKSLSIISRQAIPLAALLTSFLLPSCASFRGMPSHGGGKRFDEEQRIMTGSIRHASQKMDFSRIRSRKVALEVTGLETSGTGQAFYPGFGSVGGFFDRYREPQKFDLSNNRDNLRKRETFRFQPNYQFNPSLRANNNITRQDIDYLQRALEMRLRHDGFQIVPPEECEAYIVVLVDALGTNLSRKDYLLAYDDDLGATCELTYYAIDPSTQRIIQSSRAVASQANYRERNIRFTPFNKDARSLQDFNGGIAPLPTQAQGSFTSGRKTAKVWINPDDKKADEFVQDAETAIEANDRNQAAKAIRKLQQLNPGHPDLPNLKQSLREL